MTNQMANWYLKSNADSELATFSFDGENGGKIVLNSKYEGSSIRARYSLDGGTTWKETNDHVITLTQDELNSITANNDIKVGLVGTDAIHIIDILAGKTISTSSIYANDSENLLIGTEQNLANLEFSLDNGNTWCNYVGGLENGTRITGNQTVKVRYKAYGQYVQSSEVEYNFTEDTDTNERKYVQLKNVSLVDCSTPNSNNHKGEHMLDGNPNTGYHTRFNYREQDKFFTVEFDQERYITSIEYHSSGYNGKMRSGRILTSLDGQEWTESGRFDEIGYNHQMKTLNLDQPTKCKYIKIIPDLTYGNSEGEVHMYFSGNMFNFYEDTTIVEDAPEIPEEQPPTEEEQPPEVVPPATNPDEEVKPEIPSLGDMTPEGEGWIKTDTLAKMHELWNYTFNPDNQTIILNSFKGGNTQRNTDVKVEIPRSIGGYKVALANLNNDVFPGVTHIKVADTNEEQVKVLATNLTNGFRDNNTLKYADLEGLNVSEVTDMTQLFSFCSNLRIINISDWTIRDATSIAGMFYAKMAATDAEKKILVISNDIRISQYDYKASNRIPCIVLFKGEGGHFLGDENILNMAAARYVIRPELLDNLDQVIESDLIFAKKPVREGYEFKGWYTDDPTPTNFYELLNMTYKARWEKIAVEDTPSIKDIEVEGEANDTNKAHVLKVNTKQGLEKVLEWLNSNMSYDREENIIVDVDTNTTTYKINVFHHDKTVSYVDIKVSSDDKILIDILNKIDIVLPPTEDEEETQPPTGGDTGENPDNGNVQQQPSGDNATGGQEQQPSTPPSVPMPVPPTTPEPPTGDNGSTDNDGNTSGDNVEKPNQPEVKPEIKPEAPEQGSPEFKHEVVELVGGKGQIDNEYELVVKEVEKEVFNNFLQELKEVNTKVISVRKEGNYTLYKVKFDRVSRNTDNSVYAIIKVENGKTELVSAFNEFAVETNSTIVLPGQGSSDDTDINVKPETDTNTGTEGVVDNNTNNNTNSESNTSTNNSSTDNPKTGDTSIAGYATLGLASILGIFKNRRKRK